MHMSKLTLILKGNLKSEKFNFFTTQRPSYNVRFDVISKDYDSIFPLQLLSS